MKIKWNKLNLEKKNLSNQKKIKKLRSTTSKDVN